MTPTPETLSRVITDNLSLIYWHARRLNNALAEDIVQETCLRIMRSTSYEDRGQHATNGWVRWHVLGASHTVRREQSVRLNPKWLDTPQVTAMQPDQEHATDLRQLRERAAGLPERQRKAVELALEDHDYSEIGQELGVSKQAAHQLVKRARPALGLAA